MNNRRNFYRILHVQPEAPLEIIKASYRSLMTKLKIHPDLGGDHATAVLVNQAYVVLSDPQKRKQYDDLLRSHKNHGHGRPVTEAPFEAPKYSRRNESDRSGAEGGQPNSTEAQKRCLFCGVTLVLLPKVNKYCINCASPISPAPAIPNDRLRELFGRRAVPRITKAGSLVLYPSWPHGGLSARLRNLSPSGINILTTYGIRAGQILKFDSSNIKGIAKVVSVRTNGTHFSVHATFLTAEFITKAGFFVTERA